MLGIGGGGDVVGALATARLFERYGLETVLGGIAWERLPIDPLPGPRSAAEIVGARPLADGLLVAGPDTQSDRGVTFAETRMALYLGEPTLLLDIHGGPSAVAKSLAAGADALGADLIAVVDVGGDVLASGGEPGLASPLCDAVMLAAAAELERRQAARLGVVGAVFGPCCDGELSIEEIVERLSSLAAAGALLGAIGMSDEVTEELERVVRLVPTEASAQAIRCARGEVGTSRIRRGRRQVQLSPIGAVTFYFDPAGAVESVATLARAVRDARSLEEANEILHSLGVKTELDFERQHAEV